MDMKRLSEKSHTLNYHYLVNHDEDGRHKNQPITKASLLDMNSPLVQKCAASLSDSQGQSEESSSCQDLIRTFEEYYQRPLENRQIFFQSVLHVASAYHQQQRPYTLRLNQFSDTSTIATSEAIPNARELHKHKSHLPARKHHSSGGHPPPSKEKDDDSSTRNVIVTSDGRFVMLSSSQDIAQYALWGIGKGSMNHLHPKHDYFYVRRKHNSLPTGKLHIPQNNPFSIPLDGSNDGESIMQSEHLIDGSMPSIHKHTGGKKDSSRDPFEFNRAPDFDRHLNWATHHNPDGVKLVHPPMDQGTCGSCWAVAATGSLETSAARREAFLTYLRLTEDESHSYNNATARSIAVKKAQRVERRAFQKLDLSIQELIDCDVVSDQGCVGGNPLLAFYYLHRYGVTSSKRYPYTGKEDGKCQSQLARHPIASVKSWGIISSDHENHMELALRYIGPIAVGINGGDRDFLHYSGGIFESSTCHHKANHALLITGYGEKVHHDGNVTKYWIARNTWGEKWGENGYIRIRRGSGRKGNPGVCGVARSPSVALGGYLIHSDEEALTLYRGSVSPGSSLVKSLCKKLGMTSVNRLCNRTAEWLDVHRILSLLILGILCMMLALWPLTIDCRRRQRRRREMLQKQKRNNVGAATENTPLITNGIAHEPLQYGS